MVKKINATVRDWVERDILTTAKPNGMGKSEWIEELIIKGYDSIKKNQSSPAEKK